MLNGDGASRQEVERALKHLFHCFKVANPDVSSRIVVYLMGKPEGATVSEIKDALEVSYAMVLRIVSELESLGIVETDRKKVKKGRGRARKLVKLNIEGLKRLARQCIEIVGVLEKLEAPQQAQAA